RPGEGPARGTLRPLQGRSARHEAARRLDRALPRLLDGARGSPRTTAGDHGHMSTIDKTARSQSDALEFEFDLQHSPEKVWRALTDPELLADWLLPVVGLKLERGAAFTFETQPYPGWDGVVSCRILEIEPHSKLSYTWGVPFLDTVVTFTLAPT